MVQLSEERVRLFVNYPTTYQYMLASHDAVLSLANLFFYSRSCPAKDARTSEKLFLFLVSRGLKPHSVSHSLAANLKLIIGNDTYVIIFVKHFLIIYI